MIAQLLPYAYLVASALFIFGLISICSQKTGNLGIVLMGCGLVLATASTFAYPYLQNLGLMAMAIVGGAILAWLSVRKIAPTDTAKMVALSNATGASSAAIIATVQLIQLANPHFHQPVLPFMPVAIEHTLPLALVIVMLLGGLVGGLACSGSLIAFAKLKGWIEEPIRVKGQLVLNGLAFVGLLCLSFIMLTQLRMVPGTTEVFLSTYPMEILLAFFILALVFGVMLILPISDNQAPLAVSLFNALTGLSVACAGLVLGQALVIIAGALVCLGGLVLTRQMARSAN